MPTCRCPARLRLHAISYDQSALSMATHNSSAVLPHETRLQEPVVQVQPPLPPKRRTAGGSEVRPLTLTPRVLAEPQTERAARTRSAIWRNAVDAPSAIALCAVCETDAISAAAPIALTAIERHTHTTSSTISHLSIPFLRLRTAALTAALPPRIFTSLLLTPFRHSQFVPFGLPSKATQHSQRIKSILALYISPLDELFCNAHESSRS
jgi:hypothetical protein